MSAPTPGPWVIGYDPENGRPLEIVLASNPDKRVAFLTSDGTKAAAHLLAAAPDLLAALQELLSGHDNLYRAHFPGGDPQNDIAAKPARAAIARATGEAP